MVNQRTRRNHRVSGKSFAGTILFSYLLYVSATVNAFAGQNGWGHAPVLLAGWFDDVSKSVGDSLKKADDYIQDQVGDSREGQQHREGTDTPQTQPRSGQSQTANNAITGLTREENREIQRRLLNLGFDPGPIDGDLGKKTQSAIRRYQTANGLPVDGTPSVELLGQLRSADRSVKTTTPMEVAGPQHSVDDTHGEPGTSTEKIAPVECGPFRNRVAVTNSGILVIANDGSLLKVEKGGAMPVPGATDLTQVFPIRGNKFALVRNNGTATLGAETVIIERQSQVATHPLNRVLKVAGSVVMREDCTLWLTGHGDAHRLEDWGKVIDLSGYMVLTSNGDLFSVNGRGNKGKLLGVVPGALSLSSWGNSGMVLRRDGSIVAGIGIDSRENRNKVVGLSNIRAISRSGSHALALDKDGSVWAWGKNRAGQLGDGFDRDREQPARVQGLPSITDIAAGYDMSVAVGADGTVWAWGSNTNGSLGVGSTEPALTRPTRIRLAGSEALNLQIFSAEEFVKANPLPAATGNGRSPDREAACTHQQVLVRQGPSRSESLNLKLLPVCMDRFGLSLREADLSGADLSGLIVNGGDLEGIKLTRATLQGAMFSDAVLQGADLSNANLESSAFGGSDLSGADFSGANLFNSRFEKANLNGAIFQRADLKQANLTRTDLRNADFRNADLRMARFKYANVAGADFTGARYDAVYLPDADNIDQAKGVSFGYRNASRNVERPAAGKSDGSESADQLIAYLSGKSISYSSPAIQDQPAMDITVYPCSNGDFLADCLPFE